MEKIKITRKELTRIFRENSKEENLRDAEVEWGTGGKGKQNAEEGKKTNKR